TWVVGADSSIGFADPTTIVARGYEGCEELLGRQSPEIIRHRRLDGTPARAADCPMELRPAMGEAVASDRDQFLRRDALGGSRLLHVPADRDAWWRRHRGHLRRFRGLRAR